MSSNAQFWLRPTRRNFLVFIFYSYTIPIDSFPLLWRKSHQSHCCLYASLCNQLHVFKRWSSQKLESLFGILRIMNIHWNKKSSMSWPKVTCNTHMQNGPRVIDDARKYDAHWPALCLFPSGIYCFIQGVYKKTHKYYVHGNIGSSRIKFEYSNGLFLQIIIVHVIR